MSKTSLFHTKNAEKFSAFNLNHYKKIWIHITEQSITSRHCSRPTDDRCRQPIWIPNNHLSPSAACCISSSLLSNRSDAVRGREMERLQAAGAFR
jgi:hypothetical protein